MKLTILSLFLSGVLAANSSTAPLPVAPVNYGVLMYFSMAELDVFGPLQFLNQISHAHPINLAMIAPSWLPVSDSSFNASTDAVKSNCSQLFVPTHTYDHPPENLEVLLVPGGPPSLVPPPAAIKFIERMYPRLKYIISVGTGSRFLGQAGVLDNRNATTSKLYWTRGTEYGKNVTWIAPARYVVDGNVWTTAGPASGMDAMLGFIEHLYGTEYAVNQSISSEYVWNRNASYNPFYTGVLGY